MRLDNLETKKEKIINDILKQQVNLINVIRFNYSNVKIRLSLDELKIIDEVIFNYMDKKGKLKKYSDFMLEYFSNLMYDVVLEDEKLDFELVKRSFVYLNMNIFETRLILNKMRKRLKNEVKCKILEFPKNRR
jgi:hypothetical protein